MAAEENGQDTVQTLLSDLTQKAEAVAQDALPEQEDQAQRLAAEAQALTEEAQKPHEGQAWLATELNTIMELAVLLGELGAPIVQGVCALFELIGDVGSSA